MDSPEDFVKKEFSDLSNLSKDDWLRKMKEFAVLENSEEDLESLLDLEPKVKKALAAASAAIYFNDSSDYLGTLYRIVCCLSDVRTDKVNGQTIVDIYHLLN